MKIRLIRNATCIINMGGKTILLDPMLAPKDAFDPMPWTSNGIRNPTVDLPVSEHELETELAKVDLVLLTHLHPDHWDQDAAVKIRKQTLIICQPGDEHVLINQGFKNVMPADKELEVFGIKILQTKAIHGEGEIGAAMGNAIGFVLEYRANKLYITGDTIWCPEVKEALTLHKPQFVLANCGGAKFDAGEPVIMDLDQIKSLTNHYAGTLICIHLEALNHCYTKRADLINFFKDADYAGSWFVPEDGQEVILTA